MAFALLSRPSTAVQHRSSHRGIRQRASVIVRSADTVRVNVNELRKEEPKVVDMISSDDIKGKFPLCNGSHVKHNKENGDNVGPLIISISKE